MTTKVDTSAAAAAAAGSTDFDKLLGELDVLAKGGDLVQKGEKKKKGAADKEVDGEGAAQGDVEKKDETENEGGGNGKEKLAKSFTIKLEDGTEVEAEDGTELVKAMTKRLEEAEGKLAALGGSPTELLVKALGPITEVLKSQSKLIADLTAKVAAVGDKGGGRKAVLTIVEKPSGTEMAKGGEKEGMKPAEFMTKAGHAMQQGRITGGELAYAEACLNRGAPLAEEFIARVVSK